MSTRWLILAAALAATAGCASAPRPPAQLAEARTIYQALTSAGADQQVEADLIRANRAIVEADAALAGKKAQEDVDALAHVALRLAQTAEANNARVLAERGTDSLRRALSRRETEALRQRSAVAEQQADSLRREAEAANARLNEAVARLRSLVAEITNLQQTQRGLVISLSDILFDVGKSTLKGGAQASIGRIATVLTQYPQHQILVEGHTDASGSDAFNLGLSRDRASSVRAALVAGGVDASKISAEGYGESRPVATNDTPAGRQQNRRVEIIIVGAGTVLDAVQRDSTARPPP